MNLEDMLTVEAKIGQHNEKSLPRQMESPGTPVPHLSHSIEDILKRPSCLTERKMQTNEKNISENTWPANGKEDLKSSPFTGDLLQILYAIFPHTFHLLSAFIFFLNFFSPCKAAKSSFVFLFISVDYTL